MILYRKDIDTKEKDNKGNDIRNNMIKGMFLGNLIKKSVVIVFMKIPYIMFLQTKGINEGFTTIM